MTAPDQVTHLLQRIGEGDRAAWDELIPRLYDTLHEIARRTKPRRGQHSLQTTALVHEAFMRLVPGESRWETRKHFERVAARAMRCVLVDYARERAALKRGNGWQRVLLTEEIAAVAGPRLDLLALDEALEKLQKLDPETAEVVELRCFAGLDHETIARITGRSARTVARLWKFAKSWLERELEVQDGE